MSKQACILVVDDNRSIVRMLELVLQHNGYRVVTATDGYEALEKASLEKPDVIVLDVIMPGIDGYEVCRRLRANRQTRQLRVIFLTIKGRMDLPDVNETKKVIERNVRDRAEAFEVGALGFISKPVSAKEVLTEVRRVLALETLGQKT